MLIHVGFFILSWFLFREKVDMWGVGLVLYLMVKGDIPLSASESSCLTEDDYIEFINSIQMKDFFKGREPSSGSTEESSPKE